MRTEELRGTGVATLDEARAPLTSEKLQYEKAQMHRAPRARNRNTFLYPSFSQHAPKVFGI